MLLARSGLPILWAVKIFPMNCTLHYFTMLGLMMISFLHAFIGIL